MTDRRPIRTKHRTKAVVEDVNPPVMWPDSSFEPSGYSPAGSALRSWALIRGARRGDRRALALIFSPHLVGIGVTTIVISAAVAWKLLGG